MNANFKSWCFGAGGLCTGLLVALGMWLGRLPATSPDHQEVAAQMLLQAGGASQCDRFAACTGPVDDGGEGLFMLDFATGQLTAIVINGRTASIQARFETNVVAALGAKASDQPRYLLTSGVTDFRRTGGAVRPGASVIYVVDANTGAFAAYGIPWNSQQWANGGPLGGGLTLVGKGLARNVAVE